MSNQDRKTDINVTAPRVKVQGTAVVRRKDGSIKATLTFEGTAPADKFTPEVKQNGSDS